MSKKSLLLVLIQFSCFAYFGLAGHLFGKGFLLLLQIIGLSLGLWGIIAMKLGNFNIQPEVKTHANLVSTGPYKILRNPMYTGLLLFFGVSVLNYFSILRLGVLLLLALVLVLKIFMEEQFLTDKFGDNYVTYKKKTFRLLPFVF